MADQAGYRQRLGAVSHSPSPGSWGQKLLQALVLVLVVALASRVAAELLEPLVPTLVVLVLLAAIFWFVLRRR